MSDVTIPEAPADIPQDVWHATGMEFDKLYDAEPDLEGGCEWAIRAMAARMVIAEREACAAHLEALVATREEAGIKRAKDYILACAASIRQRSAQAIRSSHE